jgi:hypothetical protein
MSASEKYVDAEELPFSKEEILAAARIWLSEPEASDFAQQMADHAEIAAERQRVAELERLAGVAENHKPRLWWGLSPTWLLPALSVLSPSCEERVRYLMEEWWAHLRRVYLYGEQERAAKPADVGSKEGRSQQESSNSGDLRPFVLLKPRQPLPDLTPSMANNAEERVQQAIEEWELVVQEARRRISTNLGAE